MEEANRFFPKKIVKSIKSEITTLYVTNHLANIFEDLLRDEHLEQGPSGELIKSSDYFNKNTLQKFFQNDKGNIVNKPISNFYVSFLDSLRKNSRDHQRNYMRKVILGNSQYYKALKISTSSDEIMMLMNLEGTFEGNVKIIRFLNRIFPALDFQDSDGIIHKEGGALETFLPQLFKYPKLKEIVNNDAIFADLIGTWEILVLSDDTVSNIKRLFRAYITQKYPELKKDISHLFTQFNRETSIVKNLLNSIRNLVLKNKFTSKPFAGKISASNSFMKTLDSHFTRSSYTNLHMFDNLVDLVSAKKKISLPQFSALVHFDYDTFKIFLMISKTEQQALNYYNAWQNSLANNQHPNININTIDHVSTWINCESFDQIALDKFNPSSADSKISFSNILREGVLSKARYSGFDEIDDSRVWMDKNPDEIFETNPLIPLVFADDALRFHLGINVDVRSKITDEYREKKHYDISRISKIVHVDHAEIFAHETFHGSGIYRNDQKELWTSETLDTPRSSNKFTSHYIYQKGEDGIASILSGRPYYGICNTADKRFDIERRLIFESDKMKYLGTHIPIPTRGENWLIAQAKKMNVEINVNGEIISTSTLGIKDIMLNLDKILVLNSDLLEITHMSVDRMEGLARSIQERFGIKYGIGNAPGTIVPIIHHVYFQGAYIGSYVIDTAVFWHANDNIGNPFIQHFYNGREIVNHGFNLLQIFLNWRNHPKLQALEGAWDSSFPILD